MRSSQLAWSNRRIPSWVIAGILTIFALFAFGLIHASAASADPYWLPEFTTPSPASLAPNTQIVSAVAEDDLFPIVSGTMTINGFAVSPLVVDTDSNPGLAILTFDPTQDGLLATGTNNVVTTVTNSNGDIATYSWSFTVATAPTIGSVSPAPSSVTTTTLKPPVTVTLVDPNFNTFNPGFTSGSSHYYFRVDGIYPTSGVTYDSGTKTFTYQRSLNWSNNSTHTIDFSATNGAGLPVSTSWQFYISTTSQVTFTGEQPAPASTVTTSTVPIHFQVQSADQRYTFDASNPYNKIYIDGASMVTTVTYPVPSNHAIIEMQATQTVLPDGSHTAQARVQDVWGLDATDTWSFNVQAPPALMSYAPYPATSNTTPLISGTISDNGPGTMSASTVGGPGTVVMKVDGATVLCNYNSSTGVASYTPGAPLSNGSHSVSLIMTDAQGNSATQGWSFNLTANADATFSSLSPAPGSTTAVSQASVSCVATSIVNLVANQTKVRIDGALVSSTTVTQPQATRLNIAGTDGILVDGSHTASVSVTDANSYTSTRSWSFNVQTPPTVTAPIPDGGVSGTSKPPIGFWATDNSPGSLGVVLSVNGSQVYSGSVAQGAFWWVPASDYAAGTYPVHAVVTDGAGNVSTLDWSFTIQAMGGMADSSACVNCHMGFALPNHPSPTLGAPCLSCHNNPVDWTPGNPDPWVAFHDPTTQANDHVTTTTGCSGSACHDTSLITEHAKYPTASSLKFQCVTCHDSKDSAVKAAISSGNTACTACHTGVGSTPHDALHTGGFSASDTFQGQKCSGCHNSNIAQQHEDNCDACHNNADPLIQAAIASGNTDCKACHGTIHNYYQAWTPAVGNPHSGYQATTTKCGVCHAVHDAASIGTTGTDMTPGGANNVHWTADASGTQLLLRSTVANSCAYCHISTSIGGVQLYGGAAPNGVYGTWTGPGHSGQGPSACVNCHSVHGARAFKGAIADKILRFPPSESAAPGAFQTEIIGSGPAPNGIIPLYADDNAAKNDSNSAHKYQQETVFCTGCHANYTTSADAAIASSTFKAHSMVGNPSTAFSAANGGTVNTYQDNGTAVVSGPTVNSGALVSLSTAITASGDETCRSCHPGGDTDQLGVTLNSFPHYAKGTPYYLTGGDPTDYGLAGRPADYDSVGVDGNCLTCHGSAAPAGGVGVNF